MRVWERTRRSVAVLVVAGAAAACGGDDSTGPVLTLEDIAGIYHPVTLAFDPQGSVPPADILEALAAGGLDPELNIARTGHFDIFFRDPGTGEVMLLGGEADPTGDGARLTFDSQTQANQVLLPRILTLTFDTEEGTLTFGGSAQLSRARLLELFPELYGDEQLIDPTPGELTVVFQRTTGTM